MVLSVFVKRLFAFLKVKQTMNLRVFRKLKLGFLICVILALNLTFLLSVTLRKVILWREPYTHLPEFTVDPVLVARIRSQANTTVNPIKLRKVQDIKLEINDSRTTDDALYPAKMIGHYIMVNPDLCRSAHVIDIIIIVHTSPANLENRQRIRESFGKEDNFLPFHVRVAFLLGRTTNQTLERILWFEHATYNDTIMASFTDSYHNLTLKGVMGYQWVSQHCANSKFVLKIDDDVIINMYKLLYSFLNHMNGKTKSIFCNVWYKDTMPILRDGKWKVESHMFARRKTFPYDYCSGFVVLMTTDLMAPMYEAALTTPFFWIDDVYLFGMLPSIVGHVTYYNYKLDQNVTLVPQKAINCTQTLGVKCPIFASIISGGAFWNYWGMIQSLYTSSSWKVENKIVA
ncbi:beta-1,3-galactosyltransferase 1-like isoform X2 [Physella acuta]|uniref:beta-1,3-galactosyltransferase 1-like isoform X2 n=1 Tax=Physella acuta TaxID=109671 RepID=UPI0027DBD36D|nr:beta-1,3-galactosyltransferase 1-like isoform X2 [Physella acuta]